MKTYYLTLSKVFPVTHPKAGKPTNFDMKVHCTLIGRCKDLIKFHTIRANYDFWRKRFEKIAAGEAVLSIRQWVGKPYGKGSTQREIDRLTCNDGIGLQKLTFTLDTDGSLVALIDGISMPSLRVLANNDGLSLEDWQAWFKGYDKAKPLAIIHFTSFRY